MLIRLDHEDKAQIQVDALHIKEFRRLYDYMTEQHDVELALSAFAFLHYMYHFDSPFLLSEPDEKKRMTLVKNHVHRGTEIKVAGTRILRAAMDKYQEMYDQEQSSMYMTMHKNVFKLRDYAARMVLTPPIDFDPTLPNAPVLVDYKEFTQVNNLLAVQQAALEDFYNKLKNNVISKMNTLKVSKRIYG